MTEQDRDTVKRLREAQKYLREFVFPSSELCADAANDIERLSAELAEAKVVISKYREAQEAMQSSPVAAQGCAGGEPDNPGRRIIEGLKEALNGDFSRVHIGGHMWVRCDPTAADRAEIERRLIEEFTKLAILRQCPPMTPTRMCDWLSRAGLALVLAKGEE
jgi:hypothetical protein